MNDTQSELYMYVHILCKYRLQRILRKSKSILDHLKTTLHSSIFVSTRKFKIEILMQLVQ